MPRRRLPIRLTRSSPRSSAIGNVSWSMTARQMALRSRLATTRAAILVSDCSPNPIRARRAPTTPACGRRLRLSSSFARQTTSCSPTTSASWTMSSEDTRTAVSSRAMATTSSKQEEETECTAETSGSWRGRCRSRKCSRCASTAWVLRTEGAFSTSSAGIEPECTARTMTSGCEPWRAGVKHRYTPHVLSLHRISSVQKSARILRVYDSNIEAYRNLVHGGWVRMGQVSLVESAIVARRRLKKRVRRRLLLQEIADRSRDCLKHVVGHRAAEGTMRVLAKAYGRLQAWTDRRWD